MNKLVGILPFIHRPYYDEFMATSKLQPLQIMALDNTGAEGTETYNIGVAESWNRGIDFMHSTGSDWLLIVSATMRFGERGGLDILEQIEKHPYAHIINFARADVSEQNYAGADSPPYEDGVFYWHCIAIRKEIFERVGYFDPNFYPIYFEDTDFDLRLNKAYQINGSELWRIIVPIDATSKGIGHAQKKTGIKSDSDKLIAYFATKWGRHPSAAQLGEYEHPFNQPENSLKFFPPARGRVWNE